MAYISTDPLAGQPFDPTQGNRGSGQPLNQPMTLASMGLNFGGNPSTGAMPIGSQGGNLGLGQGGQTQTGTGQQPAGAGMQGLTDQQKFEAAAKALGIPLNQTRGRQQEIAQWLNQNDQPGWQAGANADDWIGTPSGQGIDFSAAGSNAFQWNNDPAGSTGGGASGGLGPFSMPTGADLQNYPGYQYAINEAMRGLQAGAAGRGTLLNARTQEGIGKSLAGYTAGVAYPQLFNQALQTHGTQFSDLYNLSQLGLQGIQTGNQ